MDISVFIQELAQAIFRNKARLLAVFGGVLVLLLLGNYTLLNVRTSSNAQLTRSAGLGPIENVKSLRRGWNIVRRGEARIVAKTEDGSQSTVKAIASKALRPLTIDMSLEPQKQFVKSISFSKGCVAGSVEDLSNGRGLTYQCGGGDIAQADFTTKASTSPILEQYTLVNPVSFNDGILSFAYPKNSANQVGSTGDVTRLLYIKDGSPTTIQTTSQTFSSAASTKIISSADKSFVVTNTERKTIAYYQSVAEAAAKIYTFDNDLADIASDAQPAFSLAGDKLFMVYSVKPSDQKQAGRAVLQSYILGDTIKKDDRHTIETAIEADTLTAINQQTIYIEPNKGLFENSHDGYVYQTSNQTIERSDVIYGLLYSVAVNGQLYYSQDGQIYRYDPDQRISQLVVAPAKPVLITGLQSVNGETVVASGYSLLSQSNQTNYVIGSQSTGSEQQASSLFPYDLTKLPLSSMDYTSNKLYFRLDLNSVIYPRDSNEIRYSQPEFNSKRTTVLNQLKKDGIDTSEYQITFDY